MAGAVLRGGLRPGAARQADRRRGAAGAARRGGRAGGASVSAAAGGLWMPGDDINMPVEVSGMQGGANYGSAAGGGGRAGGGSGHKPNTPPPDLPSLLLDSRIVFIGMPLVPAVTELIIAEILYLQYQDPNQLMYIYINSTGCSRADGEVVGHETEATAILDTMNYVDNAVATLCTGVAIGQAAMILGHGDKGKRYMYPHATAMLCQQRVPRTGQRQATELEVRWRELVAQKSIYLNLLSECTGHSVDKLDKDLRRPLYMSALDAIEYGLVDHVLKPKEQVAASTMSADDWDKAAGIEKRPARMGMQ